MRLHLRRIISGKGSAPEQFAGALRGLAVDPANRLYAVGDREVKVFDERGGLAGRWRTAKFGYCLAVHPRGDIYVGEDGQWEQFRADGQRTAAFRDPGRLGRVTCLDFVGDELLAADADARCIRRYDSQGRWLNDIGTDSNTRGFHIPNGRLEFAVDAEGVLHAINPAKFRVERYLPTGELLGHFGRFGMRRPEDFPGCCNPTNLALTPEGNVVVTEKAPPRLKVYRPDGQLLALVGPGAFDANCKNMDVAVDAAGQIFVADTVRLQICVFQQAAEQSSENQGPSRPAAAHRGALR